MSNKVQCNFFCLVLGGIGALIASVAELTAKGNISTLLRVREALNIHLGLSLESIYIVLLFMVLGVILTFASQVDNLKQSLYVGGSIITVFLTIIPNDLPPSVGINAPEAVLENYAVSQFSFFGTKEAHAQVAIPGKEKGKVQIHLIPATNKKITEVILTVRDAEKGRIMAKSRFNSNLIVFSQATGKYLLVIEVPGYLVESRDVEVQANKSTEISVNLKTTSRSLTRQRLFRAF